MQTSVPELTDISQEPEHTFRMYGPDSIWMMGGGVRQGFSYGETDDYSYNIIQAPVHVHDLHATMLHLLGIDHTKLTFKFQGRYHRLTDVHGDVVTAVLT